MLLTALLPPDLVVDDPVVVVARVVAAPVWTREGALDAATVELHYHRQAVLMYTKTSM